jgi:hypothetical protein
MASTKRATKTKKAVHHHKTVKKAAKKTVKRAVKHSVKKPKAHSVKTPKKKIVGKSEPGCSNTKKYARGPRNAEEAQAERAFCGQCKDGKSFPVGNKIHYLNAIERRHFAGPKNAAKIEICADHYAFTQKWISEKDLMSKGRWHDEFKTPWSQHMYNPEGNMKK